MVYAAAEPNYKKIEKEESRRDSFQGFSGLRQNHRLQNHRLATPDFSGMSTLHGLYVPFEVNLPGMDRTVHSSLNIPENCSRPISNTYTKQGMLGTSCFNISREKENVGDSVLHLRVSQKLQ